MRRLQFILLATVQLSGARQAGFSIHDDLVAYPQYEVVFSETFISQKEADALLHHANPHSTYAAEFSSQSDLSQQVQEARDDEGPKSHDVQETYALMHMAPSKYLCSIPILEPAGPENKTANDLAKQEEARELARASAAGWDLINELDGTCLYYMSGWWSYRFCYNREILQFHALPLMPNGEPPLRDPNTLEFVLGRGPKDADEPAGHGSTNEKAAAAATTTTTDLQVKGDQRYLVQRLDRGTICDLTGRERTIEIQYHCMPGLKSDRIGWIKEVTTCAYLMVVNTPRLCNDVAFLPPKQTSANPISCRLILDTSDPEASAAWHRRKTLEAEASMVHGERGGGSGDARFAENARPDLDSESFRKQEPVTVGGVLVGGRKVLSEADEEGKPPAVLKPPHNFLPNKAQAGKPKAPGAGAGAGAAADEAEAYETETIASRKHKAEGGELWILSDEELEELDLSPETVEDMRQEIEKLAGDKGWKLEVVEAPGEARELRGYVDDDEDDAKAKARAKAKAAGKKGPDADEEDVAGSEEQFYGDW